MTVLILDFFGRATKLVVYVGSPVLLGCSTLGRDILTGVTESKHDTLFDDWVELYELCFPVNTKQLGEVRDDRFNLGNVFFVLLTGIGFNFGTTFC